MPSDGEVRDLVVEQLKLLRGDIQGLREGVRTDLQGLRGDVGELQRRQAETNERLAVVEETLRDLAAQLLLLGRFVENVSDRYDRDLDDIKRRLDLLEKRPGS